MRIGRAGREEQTSGSVPSSPPHSAPTPSPTKQPLRWTPLPDTERIVVVVLLAHCSPCPDERVKKTTFSTDTTHALTTVVSRCGRCVFQAQMQMTPARLKETSSGSREAGAAGGCVHVNLHLIVQCASLDSRSQGRGRHVDYR